MEKNLPFAHGSRVSQEGRFVVVVAFTRSSDYFVTLAKIVCLKVIVIVCLKAYARDIRNVFVCVYLWVTLHAVSKKYVNAKASHL